VRIPAGVSVIDRYGQWEVRSLRCYELGLKFRGTRLEDKAHPFADDPSRAILVEFLAAAVCHATNWDRLRGHLINVARSSRSFSADELADMPYSQFFEVFSPAFGMVDDLPRRYEMFVTVAHALGKPSGPLNNKHCGIIQARLAGSDGLYKWLENIEPFGADPQQKKLRILIQQLQRTRLLEIADPENIRPAIEYHLIRLYLRTGRVSHSLPETIFESSDKARDVRSVNALRSAVEEAMFYTAKAAELTLSEVNEVEWQIARSFCERSQPRCIGPARLDKPVHDTINRISEGACPFVNECDAALRGIVEPSISTRHAFY
jgi:hypothetical protein